MTQISINDVQRLAQLSSLQLDDGEAESLRVDLEGILDHIIQLSELDVTGVKPTYQVSELQNIWREDEIDDYGVSREQLLELAPAVEKNQIKVPKVL